MSDSELTRERLILADKYIEGELTPQEMVRLNAILQNDSAFRRYLLANMEADYYLLEMYKTSHILDASVLMESDLTTRSQEVLPSSGHVLPCEVTDAELIAWERRADPIETGSESKTVREIVRIQTPKPNNVLEKRSWKPFIVALISLVILLGWAEYFHWTHNRNNNNELLWESAELKLPLAQVTETIRAEWEHKEYKRGQSVASGNLRLTSGKAQLKFQSGAELILEGPVQLVITDAMNLFCEKGQISAHVPSQAIGFQIATPFGNVIDRGTDFLLNVNEEATRVDVVNGRVDVVSGLCPLQSLTSRSAGEINRHAEYAPRQYQDREYITTETFKRDLTQYVTTLLARREEEHRQWDRDPNLAIRFDFNRKKGAAVANSALAGTGDCREGLISGCSENEGPLPGMRSIQFTDKGDFVRFDHPKTFQSMTLLTTVRIDSQLKLGNIFLSSIGDTAKPGEFLWQISSLGFLQFQVIPEGMSDPSCFNSKRFYLPDQRGTWSVFALAVDHVRHELRFYIDGQLISAIPWPKPIPLVLNQSVLGNARSTKTVSDRFLTGAMSEFRIYDRALTNEEIASVGKCIE